MANSAANTREGVIFLEKRQCFPVFFLIDEGDVALNADMCRAGGLARGCATLADAKGSGNRLGILLEDRFSIRQAFVVFVGQRYGADLGTFIAACAFCQIDKPGLLMDGGGQISGFALKVQKFSICKQFYVQVPADLDQFWGNDSHCTIIGGECLV